MEKQNRSSSHYTRFSEALKIREAEHLFRRFTPEDGGTLFCSNDYLGLSKHPLVIEEAENMLRQWGSGSGSARSFCRHLPLHHTLERDLAHYLGREKALLFSSGFQLNSSLLKTLGGDLFFLDQRCHRSLLEGIPGKMFRFRHNDANHLETLLKKHRGEGKEAWIVTESLFSMDGDRAPLAAITALKEKYETFLLVDEAHSIGVLGDQGKGLSPSSVDLVVGAFGKAFGGFGGFVAGAAPLIDYIANFCPGFLFTTSLPPSVIGGLSAALKLMPSLDNERMQLKKNGDHLRKLLGLPRGDQIIPYPTGTAEKALLLSQELHKKGWRVPAVRPPTVPPQSSMLRFSVTSNHTFEEIEGVASCLQHLQ